MKKLKQKNKGIILGLLLVSLIYITTQPTIVDSNGDIDNFEFSHFLKTEELKNPSVAMQIRILAKEHNFKDSNYLIDLAYCESRLDPFAINGYGNYPVGSVDRGLFQISSYWHKEIGTEQAFDLEFSTIWTMEQINKGRQSMWMCDKLIR